MHLKAIQLVNYKNYTDSFLNCSPRLNLMVGVNGSGKTNLLDAVYYLCCGKSYFHNSDTHNIRTGEKFFRLDAKFLIPDSNATEDLQDCRITVKVGGGRKKEIAKDQVAYPKLSEHIGLLPTVMIAPDDTNLIRAASEDRRKLLDNTLCQLDATYLQDLIRYNKILQQRNATLKQFFESRTFDATLLETFDIQLIPLGVSIYEKRKAALNELLPILRRFYELISNGSEVVDCQYASPLHERPFAGLLADSLRSDRQLQRTTVGIHRDDLKFKIKQMPLKRYGSQGQQRSFIIALKLALYQYIRVRTGKKPILLLDDLCDKLDQKRISKLAELVLQDDFGQIFISDTQLERLQRIFSNFVVDFNVFHIVEGTATAIPSDTELEL